MTHCSVIKKSLVQIRYTVSSRDINSFESSLVSLLPCRTPSVRTNYNINDCRCKNTSTKGTDIRRASKSFNSVKRSVRKYKTNMLVNLANKMPTCSTSVLLESSSHYSSNRLHDPQIFIHRGSKHRVRTVRSTQLQKRSSISPHDSTSPCNMTCSLIMQRRQDSGILVELY